jgi:hypothetical protein
VTDDRRKHDLGHDDTSDDDHSGQENGHKSGGHVMPGRKSPLVIVPEPAEQAELAHLVRSTTVPNGLAQRAQIILQLAASASITHMARQMGCNGASCATGAIASANTGSPGQISHSLVVHRAFPPEVAVHLVKMACERSDALSRSLSQWDCIELARQLEREDIVEHISPQTNCRILVHHELKLWRHHLWLSPNTPRDAEFYARVSDLQRKRLRIVDFASRAALRAKLMQFIAEWNEVAASLQLDDQVGRESYG